MWTDPVIAKLGLERRSDPSDHLFVVIGLFAAGAVVGSGLALLFSPRPGKELRARIRARFAREPTETTGNGVDLPDDPSAMTRAELYDLARQLQIPGRSDMSKQQLYEALSRYRH